MVQRDSIALLHTVLDHSGVNIHHFCEPMLELNETDKIKAF